MWIGFANVGLLAIMFKQSTVGYYIHAVCMWIVAIGAFVGPLIIIVPDGLYIGPEDSTVWRMHKICGIILLCIVALQCFLGMLTRHFQ